MIREGDAQSQGQVGGVTSQQAVCQEPAEEEGREGVGWEWREADPCTRPTRYSDSWRFLKYLSGSKTPEGLFFFILTNPQVDGTCLL